MLTLGEVQLERQARILRFREEQYRNQQNAWEAVERKNLTVKPDGEIDVTDLEQQIGACIHSTEFQRRLAAMNPNLVFTRTNTAFPDRISIYIQKSMRTETGGWRIELMYVAAFDVGYLPERSVRHVKRTRMPHRLNKSEWEDVDEFQRETRGWRTVLVRLLRERAITLSQIERLFPSNLDSRNWQVLTT